MAIVFEIDGVLVDTDTARRSALRAALAHAGVAIDDESARVAEHASSIAAIRAVRERLAPTLDETDIELAALRADRAIDDALARRITLQPGARDALLALAARVRLAAVTRLPRRIAQRVLAGADLEGVVATTIAADDGARAATDGGRLREALGRLHRVRPLAVTEVAALVDSPSGVCVAAAAGVWTVGVGHGAADAIGAHVRVAGIGALTYDALVQLLEHSGVRPT